MLHNSEKKKKLYEPISCSFEHETGIFSIQENKDGFVVFTIENKNGTKINLGDLVPEGYKIIGNKQLATDLNYFGLLGTDTSIVDFHTKAIIVSENELKQHGWKYILVLLHEIGHAVRNKIHPEEHEKINKSFVPLTPDADIEKVRKLEILISQDERSAWAFALQQVRKHSKDLNVDGRIFGSIQELKDFVINESLGIKVADSRKCIGKFKIPYLTISEAEKDQLRAKLSEDVARFYLHGQTRKQ